MTTDTREDLLLLCRIKLIKAKERAEYNVKELQRWHYPADDLKDVVSKIDESLAILLILLGSGPNVDGDVSPSN